jgi:hypothetical protein
MILTVNQGNCWQVKSVWEEACFDYNG